MSAALSKLGVNIDDFRAGPKQGMQLAGRLGFSAMQAGAVHGELAPRQLSESGRRHLLRLAGGLGLQMVALRADVGGARFLDSALVDQHIDTTCRVLELARDLNVSTITAPIGDFNPERPEQYQRVCDALRQILEHADKLDRLVAVETAVESPQALYTLIKDLDCANLKVCYDPAELLMEGLDPLGPIEQIADHISLSTVRDALSGHPGQPGREANLGEGQLNIASYLELLQEAGYNAELIIRRAHSAAPASDLLACKEYLSDLLKARSHA